jgi:hypothetical protein
MRMGRTWRRWLIRIAVLVVLAGNGVIVFCYWHNVWSWEAWTVYRAMDHECHPAWREYHFGGVRAGDPVEDVIARTNPVAVERKGRWTILTYERPGGFTGMGAVAYDGRLVSAAAGSCCWIRVFFDEMSDAQSLERNGQPKAVADEQLEQLRRKGIIVVK